jgi:hypothetical protein
MRTTGACSPACISCPTRIQKAQVPLQPLLLQGTLKHSCLFSFLMSWPEQYLSNGHAWEGTARRLRRSYALHLARDRSLKPLSPHKNLENESTNSLHRAA